MGENQADGRANVRRVTEVGVLWCTKELVNLWKVEEARKKQDELAELHI